MNNLNNNGKGNIANTGRIDISGNLIIDNKEINFIVTHKKSEQPLAGLGQRLNKAMKAKGVSPYKLEQNLGISRFLLCEYLNNTKEPTLSNIIILADYLNISLDWLIRGEDCIIHR